MPTAAVSPRTAPAYARAHGRVRSHACAESVIGKGQTSYLSAATAADLDPHPPLCAKQLAAHDLQVHHAKRAVRIAKMAVLSRRKAAAAHAWTDTSATRAWLCACVRACVHACVHFGLHACARASLIHCLNTP